ncbi:13716_t:CDS:2, partial [Gigaspora margarita]
MTELFKRSQNYYIRSVTQAYNKDSKQDKEEEKWDNMNSLP